MLGKLDIARSWQLAREQFAEARAALLEQQRELEALRREIDELRAIVGDVVTALRMKADSDVARLRRELERALLRLAPDPGKLLN
jgi:hypothetical protein